MFVIVLVCRRVSRTPEAAAVTLRAFPPNSTARVTTLNRGWGAARRLKSLDPAQERALVSMREKILEASLLAVQDS